MQSRGMVYNSVAQTVLLYGRKSWVLIGEMFNIPESFHHRAAKQITGMTDKRVTDMKW